MRAPSIRHSLLRILLLLSFGCSEWALAADVKPADMAGDGSHAVERGLEFLKGQQREDGNWHAPQEPVGISAIVLKAFLQGDPQQKQAPYVAKGLNSLRGFQNADGSMSEQLVTYNTAIAISTWAQLDDSASKKAIAKAVEYLRTLQWTDKIAGVDMKNPAYGGFGYGKGSRPDLSNVQTALDALHDGGIKQDDPAYQAALRFVTRCQNRSETTDQPWAGDDGGFVYTPVDGGASSAGNYIGSDGRRLLRSYGSMTYAGLKSMIYAGLSKDDPRVKAAWAWIGKNWTLSENPGMRGGQGSRSSGDTGLYYYYYTLARALHAYGEPIITDSNGKKHDWRAELMGQLLSEQQPDGSWHGNQRYMENRPVLSTAFAVLSLQEALADLHDHPIEKRFR